MTQKSILLSLLVVMTLVSSLVKADDEGEYDRAQIIHDDPRWPDDQNGHNDPGAPDNEDEPWMMEPPIEPMQLDQCCMACQSPEHCIAMPNNDCFCVDDVLGK